MADLLKNMYTKDYLCNLAKDIKTVYSAFQKDDFVKSIMDDTWDSLELKGRM